MEDFTPQSHTASSLLVVKMEGSSLGPREAKNTAITLPRPVLKVPRSAAKGMETRRKSTVFSVKKISHLGALAESVYVPRQEGHPAIAGHEVNTWSQPHFCKLATSNWKSQ